MGSVLGPLTFTNTHLEEAMVVVACLDRWRSGNWQQALAIMAQMGRAHAQPNVIASKLDLRANLSGVIAYGLNC